MAKLQFWPAAVLVAGLAVSASTAYADQIVVPNICATEPGASNNSIPLDSDPMRYQQLYAADQLGGLSGVVSQFAVRVDEEDGSSFVSNMFPVQIWLSHTNVQVGSLSTVFDENMGADKTLVYDGMVQISSDGSGAFDVVFDIDDAFTYNGVDNLILEMKNYAWPACGSQFDSVGVAVGEGGTPWTDRLWADGPDSATGYLNGDDGLVTQFTIVPEPSVAGLLALGLLALRRR